MPGSKGQEQGSPSAGRPQFEFISVSGTNIRGNAETRRRVRSRAQADYRRRNPPPPRNALTVDLDVGSWLQALSDEVAPRSPHEALEPGMQPVLQSSEMIHMDTNEFNPISAENSANIFALVPADQRPRARQLWNHLYGGCVVFKSMIEIGFLNLLQGSASLTQMLSSSAWHMKSTSTEHDESSIDYARYSLMATRALRRRLDDPVQRASLETITAILAFAAFANLTSNPQLINVHLDGLSHAITSVGGLATLRHLPVIQIMMYWIDVRGSYLQDRKPRYPQPFEILSAESKIRVAPMPTAEHLDSNSLLSQDPVVAHIFEALQQVNSLINTEAHAKGDVFWQTVLFPGFHLAPILYDLLSLPRVTHDMANKFSMRRECFRLAGILYISEVRAKFGMDNTGAISFAQKLLYTLKSLDMLSSWESDNFFLIWSLTIGSVSLCVPEALRLEFMDMLAERLADSLPDVLPIASRLFA
ncbi:hypothetical protein TGAM01_v206818 [Trichoderma gamsii]|uniref:Transcription factor domain-containing protein n=1 Tax=Trichoderma gamsii TaxID=398673 RepID=A0A2P4ZJL4_9HYPO|nr:hypothetical protein TGAM01_v206818 [Trichoderma gamsii]PON24486.1 hypothetical protein TGAM01_v206818 [Trichoderma gamsii]